MDYVPCDFVDHCFSNLKDQMFNLFKRATNVVTRPPIIGFITHGCQATIKEFVFAGKIVGSENTDRTQYYSHEFYHLVKIIVSNSNLYKEGEITKIPAWYCHEKDGILVYED